MNCVNNKMLFFVFFSSVFLLCVFSFVSAAEEKNASVEEQATRCLNTSRAIFAELSIAHFSTQRVNDTLKEMEQLYLVQTILKSRKSKTDFSIVLPPCAEVAQLREEAFTARDEFIALERFYNESFDKNINTSSITALIEQIRYEIVSERYERVEGLIDEAYEEIITIKSSNTALTLFYKTTTRTMWDFILEHRYFLIALAVGGIILFYIYKKPFARWYIQKKIAALDIRKKTIKKLIANTQREYFEDGTLSESIYTIRIRKFGELVRDIERQLPILQEDLERLKK